MKKAVLFLCGGLFVSAPVMAASDPVSHEAVYDIALASTKGGAAAVVDAHGKMSYSIQKVCGQWRTESVFSLDIGYEMAGLDTTNWKQTTKESADGCLFEFDVFVREKGQDRKDLSGKAVCDGNKKTLALTLPVRSQAVLPGNVVFPVQQNIRLLNAARTGQESASSYVYDGTRPDSLFSMNAVISSPKDFRPSDVKGDTELLRDKKVYRFDTAFFEEFPSGAQQDGTPLYEVSMYSYENGISDRIEQDFGTYRLRSILTEVKRLPEIPCPSKKKRQALTTR